jgi:HEAT repeat protein
VRCKDFERTIQVLANFISDASPDVRTMSKKCFKMLYDALPGDMDRILIRILNEAQLTKLKSHLEKDLSPMPGRQIAKSAEPRNLSERLSQKFGTGELKTTRKATSRLKMREAVDINEFEQLSSISEDMLSTEWKKRFEALSSLTQLMVENKEALVQSSKMLSAIDLLSKSLQDSNLKVSLQAFNSLKSLVHEYNKSLVPHLNILFSSLSTGLGSSNSNIREAAQQACTALIEQIDANSLLPALCNLVISMNPRTKSYILSAISNLVTKVGESKPALIQKNVLPVVFKLLDEPRCKEEINSLVGTIYASCGSMIVERAPASKIQTILDILNLAN